MGASPVSKHPALQPVRQPRAHERDPSDPSNSGWCEASGGPTNNRSGHAYQFVSASGHTGKVPA